MITKSKITINSIIEFVHTAINHNMGIHVTKFKTSCREEVKSKIEFEVTDGNKEIVFLIASDNFSIHGWDNNSAYVSINYNLTERDKLDIEALKLDVEEYNEEKAINLFNDFFKQATETPTSIDNLDDDD